MPEIGEVARIVHYIRNHLAGHTIRTIVAHDDNSVFGKAGTTAAEVEKSLAGKKILDAKQQGKYFWLELDKPPHLLMHFSMAGWFHIKGINTGYREAGQEGKEETDWPPKYTKFELMMDNGTQAAFVDFRRFSKIRLVNCKAEDMRKTTPLKENGPDPVSDKDQVSVKFLEELCAKKKAPIKAVLLDQGNISGIGNWVSDEIFFNAKMHPEQYSNTLNEEQIKQLHKSIHYVCGLACEVLADSSKFPETWLFKYRWGKGKKDAPKKLPTGEKIEWLEVGGRTSAVVPSIQKKTGPVQGDVNGGSNKTKPKEKKGTKRQKEEERSSKQESDEDEDDEDTPVQPPQNKKAKTQKPKTPKKEAQVKEAPTPGTRRSKRISSAGT